MNTARRQRPPPGQLYLDHVSHFVPDLDAAGALLAKLGFAVTPISAQVTQDGPAGTSNRCVMLREGYLEFLTPTADTPNARRMRASMKRYRGVHLVCFGTPAAEEEHARLESAGFAPQPLVHLRAQGGRRHDGALLRRARRAREDARRPRAVRAAPRARGDLARAAPAAPQRRTRTCRRLRRRRRSRARRRALGALHGRPAAARRASSIALADRSRQGADRQARADARRCSAPRRARRASPATPSPARIRRLLRAAARRPA